MFTHLHKIFKLIYVRKFILGFLYVVVMLKRTRMSSTSTIFPTFPVLYGIGFIIIIQTSWAQIINNLREIMYHQRAFFFFAFRLKGFRRVSVYLLLLCVPPSPITYRWKSAHDWESWVEKSHIITKTKPHAFHKLKFSNWNKDSAGTGF